MDRLRIEEVPGTSSTRIRVTKEYLLVRIQAAQTLLRAVKPGYYAMADEREKANSDRDAAVKVLATIRSIAVSTLDRDGSREVEMDVLTAEDAAVLLCSELTVQRDTADRLRNECLQYRAIAESARQQVEAQMAVPPPPATFGTVWAISWGLFVEWCRGRLGK